MSDISKLTTTLCISLFACLGLTIATISFAVTHELNEDDIVIIIIFSCLSMAFLWLAIYTFVSYIRHNRADSYRPMSEQQTL